LRRRRLFSQRRMVWVATFRQGVPGAPSGGGYAGLDFEVPPAVDSAIGSTDWLIFWGGLHHNVKTVRPRQRNTAA